MDSCHMYPCHSDSCHSKWCRSHIGRQGHTWQAHAGLHEDALQHDILLIQVAEDVSEHTLGPVGGVLNGVLARPKSHLRLHNRYQPIVLQRYAPTVGQATDFHVTCCEDMQC